MSPVAAMALLVSVLQGGSLREPVSVDAGMEGEYVLRYRGPELRAASVDPLAPIVLRIADRARDTDGTEYYELRFIATVPGDYDLRSLLERADGGPLEGVEPIPVRVTFNLPADHQGELEEIETPAFPRLGGYRKLLLVASVLWAAPLLVWLVVRIARRRKEAPPEPAAEPTLADQLRPLVTAAVEGQLTDAERARLERMLLVHWRDRLDLSGSPPFEALLAMKRHCEAGAILRGLEDWLHRPPGTADVDVPRLLAPYRAERAVEVPTGTPAGEAAP